MSWLRTYQHLLPSARAWLLTPDKMLRRFFDGLTQLPADARSFFDLLFVDIDPQKTRQLSEWEAEFGLQDYGLTEQERRDRLQATWATLGGQDPQYIQETLQASGFDVYVHEWWEPVPGRSGGSVNGDVAPVARNPFDYLDDGTDETQSTLMTDGAEAAQDGDTVAQDGSSGTPAGYPLVNKILISTGSAGGDGNALLMDGGPSAQDGGTIASSVLKTYPIPTDPTKYPYFLYIGGAVFGDNSTIPQNRRDEFEDLCLRICPTEQWLGILVTYN